MITHRWLRAEIASVVLFLGPVNAAWADPTPLLEQAIEALEAGNAHQALKLLTAELEAPSRPPEDRGRAFYFRAKAYYAVNQPALAIADAGAALWLKKLSPGEAADAERLRAEAQRSASADPALPPFMPVATGPPPLVTAPANRSVAVAPPRPAPAQARAQEPLATKQAPTRTAPQPLTWSAPVVKQEELPPPYAAEPAPPASKPALAWVTSVAEPQGPRETETGSVTRTDRQSASEAGQVSAPPPQPSRVEIEVQDPMPTTSLQRATTSGPVTEPSPSSSPTANLIPNLSDFAELFRSEPSPMRAELERANEFQRRYYERLRRFNQEFQARKAEQTSNRAPASDNETAASR